MHSQLPQGDRALHSQLPQGDRALHSQLPQGDRALHSQLPQGDRALHTQSQEGGEAGDTGPDGQDPQPGSPTQPTPMELLGVIATGMRQLQEVQLKQMEKKDVPEVVKPGISSLPMLDSPGKESSPVDIQDWLEEVGSIMGDLSDTSHEWWRAVRETADGPLQEMGDGNSHGEAHHCPAEGRQARAWQVWESELSRRRNDPGRIALGGKK